LPVVEQGARKYEGRSISVTVNVNQEPHPASRYGMKGLPTMRLFGKGGGHASGWVALVRPAEIAGRERTILSVNKGFLKKGRVLRSQCAV